MVLDYTSNYQNVFSVETVGSITYIISNFSTTSNNNLEIKKTATYTNLKARLPYENELISGGVKKFLYDNLLWNENTIDYFPKASKEYFGESYNCVNSNYVNGY